MWPYLWALLTPQATWAIGSAWELSHPLIHCWHSCRLSIFLFKIAARFQQDTRVIRIQSTWRFYFFQLCYLLKLLHVLHLEHITRLWPLDWIGNCRIYSSFVNNHNSCHLSFKIAMRSQQRCTSYKKSNYVKTLQQWYMTNWSICSIGSTVKLSFWFH